jgi:hypothetical protein
MSEEKTRIVPRTGPGAAGTITFHCDNGHRINAPAKLAGKRGTCSKCGIAVIIPAGDAPSAAPAPVFEQADHAEGAPAAEQADAFAGLFDAVSVEQGRKTPVDAGAVADEAGPPAEELEAISVGSGGSGVGDVVAGYAPEEFGEPDLEAAGDNPTAQLVARLWVERGHGGVVELHLAGGSVILPQWYEPRWSRGTHGLFASQAADGTVTLTAVAWDSIQKVVVRQVEGLPDGMFE